MSKSGGGEALTAELAQYRALSPEERATIDALAIEELRSPEEGVRYDYLALIREFRLVAAVPALEELAARLGRQEGAPAAYERKFVLGIIDQLQSPE